MIGYPSTQPTPSSVFSAPRTPRAATPLRRLGAAALAACSLLLSLGAATPASAQSDDTDVKRVWSIEEILSERRQSKATRKPRYCQGGVFKPCVCARDVTPLAQYRPAVRECGGNAAVILSGRYTNVFSVVVRDRENKDRWPVKGANGCTPYETNVLGLSKCSVFKVQRVIGVDNENGDAQVHCLGASGYSPLFARVTRMTAKLSDVPGSNSDPLVRWCLAGPTQPLN
jgi:hypothetical protein